MKYGFFGGSFNPVTKAHIELALEMCNKYNLDKVVFVPVGDCYNKKDLASEKHRYNMLKIATSQYTNLDVSDIELNLNNGLNTYEAINLIESKYINNENYFIMGADNIYKILSAKECNELLQKSYIFINRGESDLNKLIDSDKVLQNYKSNFLVMENKNFANTNSTQIREDISKCNIPNELENSVYKYIQDNDLYISPILQ